MNRAAFAATSEDRATDPERLGTTGERRDTRAWSSEAQCSLDRLNSQWRSDAETLRKRGATAQAVTLESCADEMETALKAWQEQLLTPEQAARETGYSAEHLRRKVRAGQLSAERHKGAKSHIKIRRRDLPANGPCQ